MEFMLVWQTKGLSCQFKKKKMYYSPSTFHISRLLKKEKPGGCDHIFVVLLHLQAQFWLELLDDLEL